MAITYTAPLAKPTIDSYSEIAGALTADTYKIRIVDRSTAGSVLTYPAPNSPASDEYSVTLASTLGIRINFTTPAATHNNVLVYVKKGSGSFYLVSYSGHTGTSYDIVVMPTASFFPLLEVITPMPYNLAANMGSGKIEISGTAGSLTPISIYNALVAGGDANYFYSAAGQLAWMGWITVTATSGSLTISNWTLMLFYGYLGSDTFTIVSASALNKGMTKLQSPYSTASALLQPKKATLIDCELSSGIGSAIAGLGDLVMAVNTNTSFTRCIILSAFPVAAAEYSYNRIICTNFTFSSTVNTITELELVNNYIQAYNIYSFRFLRSKLTATTYDIRSTNNNSYVATTRYFDDCTFVGRTLNLPIIYWTDSGNAQDDILVRRSFNLLCYDAVTQAALSGVTVTITRSDAVVTTLTTDVNGAVTETWLAHARFNKLAGGSAGYGDDYTDKTIYSHTMTLAKTGYQSETIPLTITDKIVLSVGLKPQTGGGGIINSGFIKGI